MANIGWNFMVEDFSRSSRDHSLVAHCVAPVVGLYHLEAFVWVAVKELKLSYPDGYVYIYISVINTNVSPTY